MRKEIPLSKDEFLAELLRLHPTVRVEVLPNGEKILHGIRLKTAEELKRKSSNNES